MAQNGIAALASSSQQPYQAHVPHDSALSVGSSKAEADAAKIRDLEDEVKVLAERANTACEYRRVQCSAGADAMTRGVLTRDASGFSATIRRLRE